MSTTISDGNTATSDSSFPYSVTQLPESQRKRILVTGGAGFVGSHLVDKLMMAGHEVTVVDNFFTGRKKNVLHWVSHPNFQLINHDVVEPIMLEVDQIYHLACPASPPHYQYNPVKTIKTSTMGTLNMLGLAKRVEARILLTSTSEVYGDPEVHPQVRLFNLRSDELRRLVWDTIIASVISYVMSLLPTLASLLSPPTQTPFRLALLISARDILGQRQPHRPARVLR